MPSRHTGLTDRSNPLKSRFHTMAQGDVRNERRRQRMDNNARKVADAPMVNGSDKASEESSLRFCEFRKSILRSRCFGDQLNTADQGLAVPRALQERPRLDLGHVNHGEGVREEIRALQGGWRGRLVVLFKYEVSLTESCDTIRNCGGNAASSAARLLDACVPICTRAVGAGSICCRRAHARAAFGCGTEGCRLTPWR